MSTPPPDLVPRQLAVAAAWSWRLLIIGFAIAVLAVCLFSMRVVTVPIFVAILLTTLLVPPAKWLERRGFRPAIAVSTVFLGAIAAFILTVYLLSSPIADQLSDVGPQVRKGVEEVNDWLQTGPLNLTEAEIDEYYDKAVASLKDNSSAVGAGVASGAAAAAHVIAGIFITIVLTVFLTKDGERLFQWWVNLLPVHHREKADRVGKKAWHALAGYLRGVAFTGFVDAVLIGIGLAIVGVPLLIPLVLLTFFGAFLPVVGATLAGMIAVLVALVNGGVTDAVIILLVVLLVQQVEGHVLQPLVMSRAVSVHPIVILVSLTVGSLLAGIIGAFLAVPFVAVASTIMRELWGKESPIPIKSETTST